MNQTLFPFIITTIAGFSTMLGTFIIFIKCKNPKNIIIGSLSFASSVMLFVSFLDLIPESFSILSKSFYLVPAILILFISINVGIILSIFMNQTFENKNQLYRVGMISMLAIILHNIPEGIITYITSGTNLTLGIKLAIAIALHNIPEGISIAIPIYYATNDRKKALLYTFVSGMSELLGAVLSFLFLKYIINDIILGILFGIIAGIMTHIALLELLLTSLRYEKKKITYCFFLIGIFFILISHIFIG